MNILIVKLGALGDALRTTFLAKALKEEHAGKVTWLTEKNVIPLLEHNPFIDKIVIWDDRKQLLDQTFDLVLSLDEEERACEFAVQIKSKKFQGTFLDSQGRYTYTSDVAPWFGMGLLRPHELGGRKEADRLKIANRKTFQQIHAEMLGLKTASHKPILFLTDEEIAKGQTKINSLMRTDASKILINTGAGKRWPLKMLPLKTTISLCHEITKDKSIDILLLGGREDHERNVTIKNNCPSSQVKIFEPAENLREFASIINAGDLVITSDSLALHLALARGKKTISFFGPTSPWEIDMFDLGHRVYKETDCLACYKKDHRESASCIHELSAHDFMIPVKQLLTAPEITYGQRAKHE